MMIINQKFKSKLKNLPSEAASCFATILIGVAILAIMYWILFGVKGVIVLTIFFVVFGAFMFVLNWIHKALVRGIKHLQKWASEE